MATLFPSPFTTIIDGNGDVVPNGYLRFYDAGGLVEATVYSDMELTTPISQPITADASGRIQSANGIWLSSQLYRVRAFDADDVEIWDFDNIDGRVGDSTTLYRQLVVYTGNSVLDDAQVICYIPMDDDLTLPSGATGSKCTAQVAATGSSVFTMYKNDVSIGTVTIDAAGKTGTFSVASGVNFSAGDIFEIISPTTADATLKQVGFNIRFTKT